MNTEEFEFEDDYRLKDGSMGVMLDDRGEPATCPEDYFDTHGQTVEEWLASTKTHFLDTKDYKTLVPRTEMIIKQKQAKLERYKLALKLYENAGGDFSDLRHPPHVIENYTPTEDCTGDMVRWFIFKQENNGTTFRIVDYRCLLMDYLYYSEEPPSSPF